MSDHIDTLGGRLPLADPAALDPAQREVFDRMATQNSRSRIGALAMSFSSLPDQRADLDPNGPAVSDGTRSLTNAGLLERVKSAGRHLDELGVGTGDVVALKLRNRVEFVVLLFACC